ncbi:MAG: hypothetical protein N4A45_02450 [Flavobacteriales bacterium]|jgi:hypothetical protein|nr:hypothetical protein [Flavobacteriales bacterium]
MRAVFVFLLGLVLFQINISCGNHNEKLDRQYSYQDYNFQDYDGVVIRSFRVHFSMEIRDSVHKLRYIYEDTEKQDTITFRLSENSDFLPEYFSNGKKSNKVFDFVSSKNYTFNGQSYQVYKYARNYLAVDGCVIYFWCPNFGIILKRSATWRNYQKLQMNQPAENEKLNILVELLYQDSEFYKGCLPR